MDLLEYQVKEWFRQIGIPVLPSQRIDHPTDLKRLKIRYPIVLKSQVYAGERIHAGGVRIVETTIDAIAAAQTIFNLPIWGELPEVILAETRYDSKQEFYLAVVLDTAVCRPVLLGCKEADIDLESAGEKMQYVVVEQEFSPFYARRLALKMGLQGTLMQSVSNVVEKMYELFIQQDLDLVEINPLAVNAADEVMALNGKVSINERAISRHPELTEIAAKIGNRHSNHQTNGRLKDWNGEETNSKIGILGNGTGSVMATFDLVASIGGNPGHSINLRHGFLSDTSPTTFCDRLAKGLEILTADQSIQVILINLLGSIPKAETAAEVIAKFIQDHRQETIPTRNNRNYSEADIPRLVVRLAGSELNAAKDLLATLEDQGELVLVEDLDEAVAQAVRLTKPTAYQSLKTMKAKG